MAERSSEYSDVLVLRLLWYPLLPRSACVFEDPSPVVYVRENPFLCGVVGLCLPDFYRWADLDVDAGWVNLEFLATVVRF